MRPLPRGRHGLSREFVAQDQRERLLAAIAASLDEYSYDGTTVSLIGGRARVSKSDFYRHFASKDDCFLTAYDDATERLQREVRSACAEQTDWSGRVCSGLAAGLAWLAGEPARANLLLVEGLRAGPAVYDRFLAMVDGFVPLLRKGAPAGPDGSGPPPQAADEAVIGGIASLLGRRVLAGETEELVKMFPEVAEFALTPYVGAAEARRIISAE
jgi:AcrR family transcriptional regulator